MDGTASGKEPPPVNVTGTVFLAASVLLIVLLAASILEAQTAGTSSFRVLQRGRPIGAVEISLLREANGWRIRSTSQIAGTVNVAVKQFDAQYDESWRARFLTVERVGPRSSTLVHVVVGPSTAHVDIVTAREARWHSHSISPDTVFLPDHAYAAFAAVAARLQDAGQRAEIPLLFAPDSERRAIVDAWESLTVETRAGPLRASRHTLSVIGAVPALLHVWEARGELLRVDVPQDDISVVRSDVLSR